MEKKTGVLVVGSLNMDIIQKVPYFPRIGESMPADGTAFCAGGKGANQAAQCAKLGIPTTLMGWVGNDFFGDFLMKSLSIENLNLSEVRRVDAVTGLGFVNTLPDKRLFAIVSKGANYAVPPQDLDKLDMLLESVEMLILQLEIPLEVVKVCVKKAKAHGVRVCLNAAPSLPLSDETIADCDFFIVNEAEASFYLSSPIKTVDDAKDAIHPFAKKHGNVCVFTLGANGSVLSDGNVLFHIPPAPTTVVETTGAGDSFIGGFIKGILDGYDFQSAASFAARCSAVTIANIGGIDSMPTMAEMQMAYDEIFRQKKEV